MNNEDLFAKYIVTDVNFLKKFILHVAIDDDIIIDDEDNIVEVSKYGKRTI